MIYLDTHVLIWLVSGRFDLLPGKVIEKVRESQLLISPIVELELQYLFETDKLSKDAKTIMNELEVAIGLERCTHPFHEVIRQAVQLDWARDPFDRVITAQAAFYNSILITKDKAIHAHYKNALWD